MIPGFFTIVALAAWFWIALAVGKAAARKNRRRWLWTLFAVYPLGPIFGPLFLTSLPHAGEKPTTRQLIGRSILILITVFVSLAQFALTVVEDQADAVDAWITRLNEESTTMVDETTRFDGVARNDEGDIVTRFTLVGFGADEVSQADLDEIFKPKLISGSCTESALVALRAEGYTLTYEYRGRDGGYIGAISLIGPCLDIEKAE